MKPLLIAGQWQTTQNTAQNINPSDTSDIIDNYCQADPAQVSAAVNAARDAFSDWSSTSPQLRHDILAAAGNEILARKEEIGRLLSREEGKILSEGIAEAERGGRIFLFFAAECLRIAGEKLASVRTGVEVDIMRQPQGVIGIITPWNFPIAIPAWKIAPALCYGNTVLFKPAELSPGCAWEIVEILARAGLPAGVLNLVYGPGSSVGHAMIEHKDIDAISFTGSQATGRRVAEACTRHMRKFQVEMGGKNPLVILDDADLDNAVECAVNGAFYSTGQRCTASSRIIVADGIYGRFVESCIDRMRQLKVGHALDTSSNIGPVVDATQLNQNLKYVSIARSEGGNVRLGGNSLDRPTKGHFMEPALITDTTNAMTINQEEVFGPIASVIRVKDYEEALAVANDTEFGLSCGICTNSLKYATHFRQHAEAGMVMVNLPTAGVDYHVPFGGSKGSSLGAREQGRHAIEFFTKTKTSYLASSVS